MPDPVCPASSTCVAEARPPATAQTQRHGFAGAPQPLARLELACATVAALILGATTPVPGPTVARIDAAPAAVAVPPPLRLLALGPPRPTLHRVSELAADFNPGSVGHPELCRRPCIYFAAGQCISGSVCAFCHISHKDRPAHLDKRHRQMLDEFSFYHFIALVLPIIRDKVLALGASDETVQLVENIVPASPDRDSSDRASGAICRTFPAGKTGRSEHLLLKVFRRMKLRMLLSSLILRATPSVDADRRAVEAVGSLLEHLTARCSDRPRSHGVSSCKELG